VKLAGLDSVSFDAVIRAYQSSFLRHASPRVYLRAIELKGPPSAIVMFSLRCHRTTPRHDAHVCDDPIVVGCISGCRLSIDASYSLVAPVQQSTSHTMSRKKDIGLVFFAE